MKPLTICLALFVGMIAVVTGVQAWRIYTYGSRADYSIQPFERLNPSAALKALFVGDSTIVGTGASSNTQSTAGWFGQDFSSAHIVNFSANGCKLEGLLRDFNPEAGDHYNLVVAQIGANDILRLTPLNKIKTEIHQVIDRIKPIGDTVVILHSGNVGLAPIFSWPFDQILTWRSRQVREIYIKAARERGVLYVDLFTERSNDLFLKDIGRYYSPDLLHPGGDGYRFWYERIRQTLDAVGHKLED